MNPSHPLPDLDPDEREFLDEFGAAVTALRQRTAGCPAVDVLFSSEAGVLPDTLQREVASHLAACRVCQHTLRDARDAGVFERATGDWSRVRAAIDSAILRRGNGRGGYRLRVLALAAAAVAIAVLGSWNLVLLRQNQLLQRDDRSPGSQTTLAVLRRDLDTERQRREALETQVARLEANAGVTLNVPLIDLEPVDALRSGAVRPVQVPPAATLLTLVLTTSDRSGGRDYAIEVRDANGRVQWEGTGLRSTPPGIVTLVLPRRLLPPGNIGVRLYAVSAGGRALVHEYSVRLLDAP